MNTRTLPLTLLLTCLAIALPAQRNPQPYFRNYSTEQGLPSPEVYCAFQDSRGYMWFGTDNGAARFDGYAFRTYDAQDGLASNVVFGIYEDARGRIWFGTMTGEAFILEGDTIVPYRFNHLVQRYRKRSVGTNLEYLNPEDETAYFVLHEVGVMIIDSLGNDSLITSASAVSRLIVEVEGIARSFFAPVVDRNNTKEKLRNDQWEMKNKIARFEFISKQERSYIDLPASGKMATVRNIQTKKLSSGHLLIYYYHQLCCLRDGEVLWRIPFYFGLESQINEIIEREDGTILFCMSDGNGLRIYRDVEAIRKGVFEHYFSGLSVSNAFQDPKGGLWVVTQEKGIFYSSNLELLIYDSRFGFSDDFVSVIAFKNRNELYAGCPNGDIFQVDIKNNKITSRLATFYGYHNYDLLYQPETDLLWSNAAYWNGNRWNFVSEGRNRWTGKRNKFGTSKLEKLHINASGELLGCYSTGFAVIDIRNDSVKFLAQNTNLRERTFAIHTTRDSRVWVGNARGLFEFKDSSLISPGITHPAFHHRVEDIDEMPDGSLVFGTKGWGVVRWKGKDILQITTNEGLTANMTEDVHVDENGILWVGTLNGLNKVIFDASGHPAVRRFTVANGLPSNEVNKVKSYAGQVWLCTAGGLVKFHEPEEDTLSAAPVIQHLRANGAEVPLAAGLRLKHYDNSLEFRFLAINYRQNGRIPYRYRLSREAPWQYTKNLTVNYPQLPSGEYRFEVQGQNEFGYWSPSTTCAFTILPPWWETWWARGLAALLVLSSSFFYVRRRTAQLKMEAEIRQQVAELERSALQAQMNPHFIFNCLNSIQNFILNNDKQKAVEFLARFARLVRHNLNASVQGKVSLEEEVQLLDNYLALERERFNHSIDYEIEVEEGLADEEVHFPPLLIQPYVENAVIHGLSKKKGGGKVAIRFARDNGSLFVTIRDNGQGYRQDGSEKLTARHKSVGMSITQQRLELLGGMAGEAVRVKLLQGEDGEVLGTEVKVRVAAISQAPVNGKPA